MEENSSFHNDEALIDGINKDEEVVNENNHDIENSKEKLQMDQAMDVENNNENENGIYHQEEDTEKNNYSIPDVNDKMEIDHVTENDNQNVPDVDYNQQERPSSHSSHRSSIRQNSGDIQSRIKSGNSNHSSIRELYTAGSKNSLLPTTLSNSSLNKKNINNTNSPIDKDKLDKLSSRTSLKNSGISSSRSRIHSGSSTKNQYDIMPQVINNRSSTVSSSNDEYDDSKSLMTFGSKVSEISLLSESMAKEQISERLLKRLYSVTSKTVPQSHFRFNGKRTTSGVRLNPIVQSTNTINNCNNPNKSQKSLVPIDKTPKETNITNINVDKENDVRK